MRVVTLLPSATEMVYALGVEPVATSHECDYPIEAADKPAANYVNIDHDGTPAAINEQVLEAERNGGVYGIDLDVLSEADPDVIVTQGVCDVCAVDSVLVDKAAEKLELKCEIVTTDPHTLSDVFDDIERLGNKLDREQEACKVVEDLRDRVEQVKEDAEQADGSGPRVAVLDWTDPVMVAGHWIPGMVESLGATYGMELPGRNSRQRDWDSVRGYDPEVLIVAPCGFKLDRTLNHLEDLMDKQGWEELTAVREGCAYAMDGHDYVNRPGPRLVDTLAYTAGLVFPNLFDSPPRDVARPIPRQTV